MSLTHFNEAGQAHMVDIGEKQSTRRKAVAEGYIKVSAEAFNHVQTGSAKKGDVLGIARIAAIQASKLTSQLIPLCHPLSLTKVNVNFELLEAEHSIRIEVTTETMGQTGVEMEALCAANVGLLTVYDMLKAVDKNMSIHNVQVIAKAGGRSGDWSLK